MNVGDKGTDEFVRNGGKAYFSLAHSSKMKGHFSVVDSGRIEPSQHWH